jgi:serine/threonine-protein kinase
MRADLFAAAAVFWEMLSGKPCFAGTTQVEILSQVIYGEPQAPAVASASSHSALFATLGRTLAKNPGERFGSAAEFAAALRHASTGNAPAATSFDDSFVDTSDADHTVVASTRSGLEAHVVEQAEKELATFIGPLAKVFVKKAAATAASPSDLYQSLAREIADESDRTRFLRHAVPPSPSAAPAPTLGGVSRSGVGTRPVATTGIPPVTAEAQAAAQTALTVFLGPIAKVLVRQAASQGGTAEEFFGRLIAHLTRDEDRAAFRRQLQKYNDPKF